MKFDVQKALAEIRAENHGSAGMGDAIRAIHAIPQPEAPARIARIARIACAGGRNSETVALPIRSETPDIDAFEERAAIIEFDGGLSRSHAELLAAQAQGYVSPAALVAAGSVVKKEVP